jgi:LysM repeat protein
MLWKQSILLAGARRILWCAVLACLFATSARADQLHIVQRNDTLYGIARRHGISVAELAERNGLAKSTHIYVGQRLMIPTKQPPAPARSLDPAIRQAIDSARVNAGRWKHIVIHHSGASSGTVQGMDRYHREERRMENGLAYHFVIGNGKGMRDGEVAVSRRWREQLAGGHLASEAQNKISIGICLVGDFEKNKPTDRQMQSLAALVDSLMRRTSLPVSAVRTHQQINVVNTRCPGKNFPLRTFLQDLERGKK